MLRKIIFPLILGVSGIAVLLYLGFWQVQRLEWKEDILSNINARLASSPVALPETPVEKTDEYTPVSLSGIAVGDELHVLVSGTAAGTGYRVISAFETTDGRRILLDQGLLALDAKIIPANPRASDVTGTLIWPDDVNSSTPDPDLGKNIWFARDVTAMSKALETEPVMVVVRSMTAPDNRLVPLPINTANIKNDHREYAITWFLLAAVWLIMTIFLILRTTRQKDA